MRLRVCGILWRSFGSIVGSRGDVGHIRFLYNPMIWDLLYNPMIWDLVPTVCSLVKLFGASTYGACTV
jgi:hypothetical protein